MLDFMEMAHGEQGRVYSVAPSSMEEDPISNARHVKAQTRPRLGGFYEEN